MKGYYLLLICFIFGSIFSIILSFKWTKKEAARGTGPSWTISAGNPLINFLLGIVKCMSFKFQKINVIILSFLSLIFFSLLLFFT
ncbi:hypothetical protein AMD00_00425 [Viridibacillus arvi]|uniref:Uncharacterized protein n=1 Tax=Viridibacillus arvi TaxID=263475 RepID=A0A0M0LJ00_9BACL|nr:hypothetical protein AMD00_00425 [Viridibacillus arvi]